MPENSSARSARDAGHAAPATARLPDRIGDYRPIAILGHGGMATVYLADAGVRLGAHGLCALKVLNPALTADDDCIEMFVAEAKIASEVAHPHLCSVFDFGFVGRSAFLAMEYLDGRTLSEVVKVARATEEPRAHALRVARVLADACEGLQALHELCVDATSIPGVIHRDISPDNLILTFDGFVKLIDFGLAKTVRSAERTSPGIVKGKLGYLAPEILSGGHPTPQCDIWSLGVVAWECLTGKRLFRASCDAATFAAVLEQVVPPPSMYHAEIPSALDRIVMRALARDPHERYPSAAAFAEALWEFMAAEGKIVQHGELAAWMRSAFPDRPSALGVRARASSDVTVRDRERTARDRDPSSPGSERTRPQFTLDGSLTLRDAALPEGAPEGVAPSRWKRSPRSLRAFGAGMLTAFVAVAGLDLFDSRAALASRLRSFRYDQLPLFGQFGAPPAHAASRELPPPEVPETAAPSGSASGASTGAVLTNRLHGDANGFSVEVEPGEAGSGILIHVHNASELAVAVDHKTKPLADRAASNSPSLRIP